MGLGISLFNEKRMRNVSSAENLPYFFSVVIPEGLDPCDLPFDTWCLGETVRSCWENDRKAFLFLGKSRISLSQGVLQLWLGDWFEVGILILKQTALLGQ